MLKDRRFTLVCRILQSHHLPSHAAQLFHNKWQHLPTFLASQISEGLNRYIPTQRENFQVGAKKKSSANNEHSCFCAAMTNLSLQGRLLCVISQKCSAYYNKCILSIIQLLLRNLQWFNTYLYFSKLLYRGKQLKDYIEAIPNTQQTDQIFFPKLRWKQNAKSVFLSYLEIIYKTISDLYSWHPINQL